MFDVCVCARVRVCVSKCVSVCACVRVCARQHVHVSARFSESARMSPCVSPRMFQRARVFRHVRILVCVYLRAHKCRRFTCMCGAAIKNLKILSQNITITILKNLCIMVLEIWIRTTMSFRHFINTTSSELSPPYNTADHST